MYYSRSKRPKLKATDRRPTVDMTATLDDESTDEDHLKQPQTVDEIRRLLNRRSQNTQPVIKPYVGKRTAVVIQDEAMQETSRLPEECASAAAANTASSSNVTTSACTVSGDTSSVDLQCVQSVKYQCSSSRSKVKTTECEKSGTAHSVDTNCLPKEKLVRYLHAVG